MTVDILVSNRNSWEALQLCVESVRHYTHGEYRLVVYDDGSNNDMDLPYLCECHDRGWLELIAGRKRYGHGTSLNLLINGVATADYAVTLDSDTQVKSHTWLQELLAPMVEDEMVLAVVNYHGLQYRTGRALLAPFCEWWFGALNMRAYRDGMQGDWRSLVLRTSEEYRTLPNADALPIAHDKLEAYIFETGCQFYQKVLHDNPKQYRFASPFPPSLASVYHHYLGISHQYKCGDPLVERAANAKMDIIRRELEILRHCQR